jgi:predicted DsbA family dithiol-disulfide isomerase
MIETKPGTVVVYADIGCPWAHRAVFRLHEARRRRGLEDRVRFDIHAFPLELINERPTPKKTLDAEAAVLGELDPDAGWGAWDKEPFTYPVTTLLAMEAVFAAKEQGVQVSDSLDRALRLAFFQDARCISLQHEILEVARTVPGLAVQALERELTSGRHRSKIFDDLQVAQTNQVKGSPHVFAGGEDFHNPGTKMRWDDDEGVPVIEADDPSVYDRIMELATKGE